MATAKRIATACALLALLVSAPLAAQDPAPSEEPPAEEAEGETTEGDGEEVESEEPAAAEEGDVPEDADGTDAGEIEERVEARSAPIGGKEAPLDDELQRYWSAERNLSTIESKLYSRDGRLSAGIYTGLMSSEPFWWYVPLGGRLSYNFSDYYGLEVGGQYNLDGQTDLHSYFAGRGVETFDSDTDLEDRMIWRANALFVWSPLYGKWAFLNNKLSHFDFNLVAGAGAVGVNRPNVERTEASSTVEPEVVLGGGIHFFLAEHWLLRADGRVYFYQGAETESSSSFFERLQVPTEFLLGGSYLF